MVKKKARSKGAKKSVKVSKVKTRQKSVNMVRASNRKMKVVNSNLLLFIILTALSVVIYNSSSAIEYKNLFFLLSVIFGFISIAFLIIFLIFLFLRTFRK